MCCKLQDEHSLFYSKSPIDGGFRAVNKTPKSGNSPVLQHVLSPDIRWLAYVTDRIGRNEVYVTSFPTAGAQTQLSTDGGTLPAWSPDGKELVYLGPDRKLMAAAVKAGSRLEAGIPKPLFEVRFSASTPNTSRFDVSGCR